MNKINSFFQESNKSEISKEKVYLNPDGEPIKVHVNNVGFNATLDFYESEVNPEDICIIGDSFIASYNCGIDNSISFLLNKKNPQINVYNFGVEGGNINDYFKIYEQFKLNKLKKVFILLTGPNDLIYKNPLSLKYKSKEIGYLKFLNGFNIQNFFLDKKNMKTYSTTNFNLLVNEYPNIVFVLHKGLFKSQIPSIIKKSINIIDLNKENLETFNDGHYTKNGNLTVANRLQEFVSNIK